MNGRPVQNSSGKRKVTCREPSAWRNQSCSLLQTPELPRHRRLQEPSTGHPKDLWPGESVSYIHTWLRGEAVGPCQRPAMLQPATMAPQRGSPTAHRRTGSLRPVSPTWPGLLHPSGAAAGLFHAAPRQPAASKGPCFRLFLTANVATWLLARGAGCCSPAGLPIYLLFLARGATRERYGLLPTLSAWEQGTRPGARAQSLAVPCC